LTDLTMTDQVTGVKIDGPDIGIRIGHYGAIQMLYYYYYLLLVDQVAGVDFDGPDNDGPSNRGEN